MPLRQGTKKTKHTSYGQKKENMSHCPGITPGLLFYFGASPQNKSIYKIHKKSPSNLTKCA